MRKIFFICFLTTYTNLSVATERQFAKDHPSMASTLDDYRWYINHKNGAGSCKKVYAFGAGNPTPDLNMIYISCDKDKSEWVIGIDKRTGSTVGAKPTRLYKK